MDGFFNALSDFLKSDLAKGYGWVIFVAFVICVFIVGIIMWFVFVKLIVPAKLIEANNVKNKYDVLLEENKTLKEENSNLKKKLLRYKYMESMNNNSDDDYEDRALNQFVN